MWLGAAALNDVIIAACMIWYLQRARTGIRQTETLITKFIHLTLETGAICAAFAVLDLSFYVAFQTNNYHLAPSIPLSKLYSNSLLVVRFITFVILLCLELRRSTRSKRRRWC